MEHAGKLRAQPATCRLHPSRPCPLSAPQHTHRRRVGGAPLLNLKKHCRQVFINVLHASDKVHPPAAAARGHQALVLRLHVHIHKVAVAVPAGGCGSRGGSGGGSGGGVGMRREARRLGRRLDGCPAAGTSRGRQAGKARFSPKPVSQAGGPPPPGTHCLHRSSAMHWSAKPVGSAQKASQE